MKRRVLMRLLAMAVLAGGLVPVLAGASWACSCVAADLAEHVRAAAQVYVGDITEITQLPGVKDITYQYSIEVKTVIKGAPATQTRIASPAGEAQCGIVLQRGPVLAFDRRGDGNVDLCDGTTQRNVTRLAAQAQLAQLPPAATEGGSAEPVAKETKTSGRDYAIAGLSVLVASTLVLIGAKGDGESAH